MEIKTAGINEIISQLEKLTDMLANANIIVLNLTKDIKTKNTIIWILSFVLIVLILTLCYLIFS
jgi:hypothetical protein